ncbi:integrase core domain-containing protein [Pseudonocardia alaniniphila]|uniref:integrase core domain-containing protein n=1 Tax=Pseudonocardia alaniniphila TaxID=75291 RepID=UPI00336D2E86
MGWQLATHLRTDLALDALEMAIWQRHQQQTDLSGLVHHSGRGVQYLVVRYTERLAEARAVSSVGSRGDSYDNALAESFNGLFKTELIRPHGPWRGLDDLELAVLEYVDGFNYRRLHSEISMLPPAEAETAYYRQNDPVTMAEVKQSFSSRGQGGSGSYGRGVSMLPLDEILSFAGSPARTAYG